MSDDRPTVETARLVLRPLAIADAADVQRLAGAFELAEMTVNIPHPYEDGMAEAWIQTHAESNARGADVTFAITRKEDGVLLGAISLMGIKPGHMAEMGYWIGVEYWGRGFCTEAGQAVIGYGFEHLDLKRIHAHHFSRNPASGRVMQKLGMSHEGHRRLHAARGTRLEDIDLYGIVASDWEKTA